MDKLKDLKILEAILFASNEPLLENDLKDKRIIEKNFFIFSPLLFSYLDQIVTADSMLYC